MEKKVRITFTGDIMCDNQEVLSKINYSDFFDRNVEEIFENSDYSVGNLETPILKEIKKNQKKYSFSAPIDFAKYLRKIGIDFVSTANNHCLDCGIDGLIDNVNNLNVVGLDHTGTYINRKENEQIFIKELKGIKVAFLSFTYGTNAFINNKYLSKENEFYVDLLKKQEFSNKILRKVKDKFFENIYFYSYKRDKHYLDKLDEKIKQARKKADIVVLCLHSGGQYNKKVDWYTKRLCNYVSELGVDVIIGNHPHVILGNKKIKNTFVFYSLGNFFATPFSNHNQKDDYPDYSIILNIDLDVENRSISNISYSIVKTIMNITPKTYNIYDIYMNANEVEREKIKMNVKKINQIFNNDSCSIKKEYTLNIKLERK